MKTSPNACASRLVIASFSGAGSAKPRLAVLMLNQLSCPAPLSSWFHTTAPPSPPPPDPKLQAAQVKVQGDLAKTQASTQGRMMEIQAEARAVAVSGAVSGMRRT